MIMEKPDYYQRLLHGQAYANSRQDKARLISRILGGRISKGTENIVDLGSGSGLIKQYLEQDWGRPVIGIECARPFIKYKANTCAGDVSQMPFGTNSIDLAICNHLFEHVGKKQEFVSELKRVVKPNGFVYFTICNKYKLLEPHYRLPFLSWLPNHLADIYLKFTSRGEKYQGIEFFAYKDLAGIFSKEGLKVQNITWDVITQNNTRMGIIQRVGVALAGMLGQGLRNFLIDNFSPQWFLIITK